MIKAHEDCIIATSMAERQRVIEWCEFNNVDADFIHVDLLWLIFVPTPEDAMLCYLSLS